MLLHNSNTDPKKLELMTFILLYIKDVIALQSFCRPLKGFHMCVSKINGLWITEIGCSIMRLSYVNLKVGLIKDDNKN